MSSSAPSADADGSTFGSVPRRSVYIPVPANLGRSDSSIDTLAVNLLTADLILSLIFQKLAIPMGGSQLESPWFINAAVFGFLFLRAKVVISALRTFLFLLTFSTAIVLQLIGPRFNPGSFLLSVVVAVPFIAILPASSDTYMAFLKRFQLIAIGVVGLVFMDHGLQLAGLGMPDLERIMPFAFIYTNYNYIQPLYWGSPLMKPNAVFFLEASFTSQFIAMALIFELAFFRRIRFVVAFGAGMMAVFAGTGFVLALTAAPFLLTRYLKARVLVFGLLAVPVVLGIAAGTGWLDVMSSRTQEFGKNGASGHARFVAPFAAVATQLTSAPEHEMLFGVGAGNQEKSTDIMLIPMTKMVLDYGVIVLVFYMIFTMFCIFSTGAPLLCAWLAFFDFHILNGGSSQPITQILCYLVVAAYQILPVGADVRRLKERTPAQGQRAIDMEPVSGVYRHRVIG